MDTSRTTDALTEGTAAAIAAAPALDGALALGLDIGTTSISAAVTNGVDSFSFSIPNGCDLRTEGAVRTQEADKIADRATALADALIDRYDGIGKIGVDGQMHGILYLDGKGRAVSTLMTWQDARANLPIGGAMNACERVARLTGYKVYAGYGLATHYYNLLCGLVPGEAEKLATVGDYVAMRLTGRAEPAIHPTNAASLGLFDVRAGRFDCAALGALGVDCGILPEVSASVAPVGSYRGRTVFTAVGDSQAAYYGVMRLSGARNAAKAGEADDAKAGAARSATGGEAEGVLCNFGTGSQVCVAANGVREGAGFECRPYFGKRYLLSGSALCGGRAYAALERFFRAFVGDGKPQYDRLGELAEAGYAELQNGTSALRVDTRFCGTRDDPSVRGAITGIGEGDLTPQALAVGVLRGMVDELYGYFKAMEQPSPSLVTLSGNAARRNPVLVRLAGDVFGAPVVLSDVAEEAATGAALLALVGE